jgi:MFS family permease
VASDGSASSSSAASRAGFRYYLASNISTWAGIGIADVLFFWLVFTRTSSPLAVAYVGIAAAVPAIALGFPAGVLADRYRRDRLLALASGIQTAALTAVPFSLLVWGFQLDLFLVLVVIVEGTAVVYHTCANALVPSLVPTADIERANGQFQAFTAVSVTAGAVAGSLLLGALNDLAAFALATTLYFAGGVSTVLLLLERDRFAPTAPAPVTRGRFWAELADGFRYLRSQAALLELTIVTTARGFFVAMFSPFLVVYVVLAIDVPGSDLGFLVASFTGGYFVGSLGVARLGVVRAFGTWLAATLFVGAGLLAALVGLATLPVALVVLGVLGLMLGVVMTAAYALAQRMVPTGLLGRYFSINETLTWATIPAAVLLGGYLVSEFGILDMIAVAAVGLAVSGVGALSLKHLRGLRAETDGTLASAGASPTTATP